MADPFISPFLFTITPALSVEKRSGYKLVEMLQTEEIKEIGGLSPER